MRTNNNNLVDFSKEYTYVALKVWFKKQKANIVIYTLILRTLVTADHFWIR